MLSFEIGSYNSYNKETNLAATLDVYENDFIDDGDNSNSTEEDEVSGGENSLSDQSMEDESQLHTSLCSRKRKGRLSGDSSSEEGSNSDVVTRKKRRPAPMRYLLSAINKIMYTSNVQYMMAYRRAQNNDLSLVVFRPTQHMTEQNPIWLDKFTVHFQWKANVLCGLRSL